MSTAKPATEATDERKDSGTMTSGDRDAMATGDRRTEGAAPTPPEVQRALEALSDGLVAHNLRGKLENFMEKIGTHKRRSAEEELRESLWDNKNGIVIALEAVAALSNLGSPVVTEPSNEEAVVPAALTPGTVPGEAVAQAILELEIFIGDCENAELTDGSTIDGGPATKALETIRTALTAGKAVPGEERRAALEEAARECERVWKSAPNENTGSALTSYQQNALSHGCLASAAAIRALLSQRPGQEGK